MIDYLLYLIIINAIVLLKILRTEYIKRRFCGVWYVDQANNTSLLKYNEYTDKITEEYYTWDIEMAGNVKMEVLWHVHVLSGMLIEDNSVMNRLEFCGVDDLDSAACGYVYSDRIMWHWEGENFIWSRSKHQDDIKEE